MEVDDASYDSDGRTPRRYLPPQLSLYSDEESSGGEGEGAADGMDFVIPAVDPASDASESSSDEMSTLSLQLEQMGQGDLLALEEMREMREMQEMPEMPETLPQEYDGPSPDLFEVPPTQPLDLPEVIDLSGAEPMVQVVPRPTPPGAPRQTSRQSRSRRQTRRRRRLQAYSSDSAEMPPGYEEEIEREDVIELLRAADRRTRRPIVPLPPDSPYASPSRSPYNSPPMSPLGYNPPVIYISSDDEEEDGERDESDESDESEESDESSGAALYQPRRDNGDTRYDRNLYSSEDDWNGPRIILPLRQDQGAHRTRTWDEMLRAYARSRRRY